MGVCDDEVFNGIGLVIIYSCTFIHTPKKKKGVFFGFGVFILLM
jgi:hypothetical protein